MNLFSIFRNLVSIPSVSGYEKEIKEYICSFFFSLGYRKDEDEKGNMLFYLSRNEKKLCLSAHLDTVPLAEKVNLIETDEFFMTDRRCALGADDKAAVAAFMKAAEKKEEHVIFLFTVGEEKALEGARMMGRNLLKSFDIALIIASDASGKCGDIIQRAPGKTQMDIRFRGKSAHAGFEIEKGDNAVLMLSRFVIRAENGRQADGSTINCAIIDGGKSTNIVPDCAHLALEIRSLDENMLSFHEKRLNNLALEINTSAEVDVFHHYRPYFINEDSREIRFIRMANADAQLIPTLGGSDVNIFRAMGYRAVNMTTGYENAHSENERMSKTELEKLYEITALLADTFQSHQDFF